MMASYERMQALFLELQQQMVASLDARGDADHCIRCDVQSTQRDVGLWGGSVVS